MSEVVLQGAPRSVVLQQERSIVVTRPGSSAVVVNQPAPPHVVITRGIPGPAGDAGGAFLVNNRLSELTTETEKAAARSNLGLQVIDGGTFN